MGKPLKSLLIFALFCFVILTIAIYSYKDLEELTWQETPSDRRPANESANGLVKWVDRVPFSSRLNDYMEALGVKQHGAGHSGANEGLAAYNNKLLSENPCFAELSTRFLDEIKMQDFEKLATTLKFSRPTLADRLDEKTKPKAGFLWDLALKYSNGDKNLAMSLIGVCGHDDSVSVDTKLPSYNDSIVSKKKHDLFHRLSQNLENAKADPSIITAMKDHLFKPGCPASFSSMFMPGSLSPNADIPEDLKTSVAQTQAPKLGASALPAKHYHVIAGAVSTCLLYQRGVPSIFATEIHTRATNAYRSKTICSYIRSDVQNGEALSKTGFITDAEITDFVARKQNEPELCGSQLNGQSNGTEKLKLLCSITMSSSRMRESSGSRARDLIRRALTRADAGWLLSKTKGYSKIGSCAAIDINSRLELSIDAIKARNCPKTWSKERCQSALSPLASWSLDFKWTRTQHQKGERFARKNCNYLWQGKDKLANACVALEKVRSPNPKPPASSTSPSRAVR